jgi:Biotin/lipoate A/B protein ligase family
MQARIKLRISNLVGFSNYPSNNIVILNRKVESGPKMPFERYTRLETPYKPALDLPPLIRLVTLREVGDAFANARTHSAEFGGGTLVHVGRFDVAEFALVLEPDECAPSAWRALYAGMVALADALATIAPPGTPIAVEWPDAIRLDGRLVGGGRLAWPDGADDAAPPPCFFWCPPIWPVDHPSETL